MNNSLFWLVVWMGVFSSCSSVPKSAADVASHPGNRVFTLPSIPTMLTTPEAQSTYLAAHYWDSLSLGDTAFIRRSKDFEQHFVNYLSLLPSLGQEQMAQEVDGLLRGALQADTLVFARFTALFEQYCYDPNSPLRNEELYLSVVKSILALPSVSDVHKVRLNFRLEMMLKNRVGEVAHDFTYTLGNGRRGRLSAIHSEYTLLFFNNPDCEECKRWKELMRSSDSLNRLIGSKQGGQKVLTVLSVYPDKELKSWRQTVYPEQWINAYDATQEIDNGKLYDLKAIPCLYLLDCQKRVIFKDAVWERIEQWLANK